MLWHPPHLSVAWRGWADDLIPVGLPCNHDGDTHPPCLLLRAAVFTLEGRDSWPRVDCVKIWPNE